MIKFKEDPTVCLPLRGAQEIMAYIKTLKNWNMGIATGGWIQSALLKLNIAKIPHTDIPKSFCDKYFHRLLILKQTIKRALNFYKVTSYSALCM